MTLTNTRGKASAPKETLISAAANWVKKLKEQITQNTKCVTEMRKHKSTVDRYLANVQLKAHYQQKRATPQRNT